MRLDMSARIRNNHKPFSLVRIERYGGFAERTVDLAEAFIE
jgi:hypothetical protein